MLMKYFFVPDQQSVNRCRESQASRRSITIYGVAAISGNRQAFTGIVQSIEDFGVNAPQGQRWRITMVLD